MRKLTEAIVQNLIANHFGIRNNIVVPNLYWGIDGIYYEIDLAVVSKKGYLREIEIKLTVQDLKRDAKKMHNHDSKRVSEVCYAIPEKLLKHLNLIPEKAGIIVIYNSGKVEVLSRGKLNRKAEKLNQEEILHLYQLINIRYWNLRSKIYKEEIIK